MPPKILINTATDASCFVSLPKQRSVFLTHFLKLFYKLILSFLCCYSRDPDPVGLQFCSPDILGLPVQVSWCSLPWFQMQRWVRPRSSNDLGVACCVTWRRSQQEATDWTLALPKHGQWKIGYRSQGGSISFLFWWLPGSDPSAGNLVWGLLGEPETFKPLNTENQFCIIAAVLGWLWLWPGTLGRGK